MSKFKPTDELQEQLISLVKCDSIIIEVDKPCTVRVWAARGGKKLFALEPICADSVTSVHISGIETTPELELI